MTFNEIILGLLEGNLFSHKDMGGGYIALCYGEEKLDDKRLYFYNPKTQSLERYALTRFDILRDDWIQL